MGQIVAKGGNVICNQHYFYDMLVIKKIKLLLEMYVVYIQFFKKYINLIFGYI
jgi:hypothetical protein